MKILYRMVTEIQADKRLFAEEPVFLPMLTDNVDKAIAASKLVLDMTAKFQDYQDYLQIYFHRYGQTVITRKEVELRYEKTKIELSIP